jgi:hypothetical protein
MVLVTWQAARHALGRFGIRDNCDQKTGNSAWPPGPLAMKTRFAK